MSQPSILFLQATNPAIYPPLINAGWLLAEAGFRPVYLSSPHAQNHLTMPPIPGMIVDEMPVRPSYVMAKGAYLAYIARAISLARKLRPSAVYASDPLGALPGILAAKACGAVLIYHEHDSPSCEHDLNLVVRRARAAAGKAARLVVFPNEVRAERCGPTIHLSPDRVAIVWNVPRRAEIPSIRHSQGAPFILYYHGSINPERLPMAVAEAVNRFGGRVVMRIAGYTTGSGETHMREMIEKYGPAAQGGVIDYVGQVPSRDRLLEQASAADAGLALMPMQSADINMTDMVGASNKPFDYMAAGLPVIVSELLDWRVTFVDPGHGLAANPDSPDTLQAAVSHFLSNPEQKAQIGRRNRNKIVDDWNYDTQFRPVVQLLNQIACGASGT